MRKILSVLLTVCILLSTLAIFPITTSAATTSGTCGDNLTWSYDTTTATLTISGTGAMTDYSDYNGTAVTTAPWGSYYNTMKTAIIGDGVTSIGEWAFFSCDSLTTVTMGNDLTSIGDYAFYRCKSLTSVTIGNSVTSIDYFAFEYCYKLVEVINKSSLSITKGSNSNGKVAYYALEVHSGETKIVDKNGYMFYTYNGVNYLMGYKGTDTELTLPEYYNGESYEIFGYAFYNCTSITSVMIPNSITSIGDSTFSYCHSLTTVTIPDSVTSIGDSAFSYCTSLTSVTIPDSVTSIGYRAFYDCYRLTTVTIGNSVENIGSDAFEYCSSLTTVNITDIGAWCNISFSDIRSNPLHYAQNLYLNGKLVTELVIPDSVTSIGKAAFSNCTSLTTVSIPDSVTSIGSYAFEDCTSLTSVTIPDSVTSIGSDAFSGCSDLTILCNPGSYAQTYAIDNNIPYILFGNITSLSIKTSPAKTVYPMNGTLNTAGLILEATYDDGNTYDITSGFTVGDYDFSTPGEKDITVTLLDVSATFTVTVDADLVEYPESAHPYASNSNETWTYTHKTAADSLEITFSSDTETESWCDYIYIYDKDGNEIGCYSGTQLAGQTVTVPGNSFSIKLTSDGSIQYYGFAIDNIKANGVPQDTKRGDLNGDNKVNASDALTIRKIIVGKLAGEQYKTVADLNGDNKVNASDSLILKRIIVGKA